MSLTDNDRESPRWLMEQGRLQEARKAMHWLRPDPAAADRETDEIEAAMEQERAMKSGLAISDMWTNPVDRRRTIIAVAAVNTQAASGAMFMIGEKSKTLLSPTIVYSRLISTSGMDSLWNIFLLNGWNRQAVSELLYPRGSWRSSYTDQQLRRDKVRPTKSLPHHRFTHLWTTTTDPRRCVYRGTRHRHNKQSHRLDVSLVHRVLQCESPQK